MLDNPAPTLWQTLQPDEKAAVVRRLVVDQTMTYGQAATELGTTRLAVAGVAHRNKIKSPYVQPGAGHAPGSAGGQANAKRRAALKAQDKRLVPVHRAHKFVVPPVPEIAPDRRPPRTDVWNALPGTEPRRLSQHHAGQCLWPIGADDQPFMFCCEPAKDGPWCPAHRKIAYRPLPAPKFNGRKTA